VSNVDVYKPGGGMISGFRNLDDQWSNDTIIQREQTNIKQAPNHINYALYESPRNNWCYISRICPVAALRPICTNFGLHVRLVDVINC